MDADVGEAGRCACAQRVRAPNRLLVPFSVDWPRQPVLNVGGMNNPNVADVAACDHFAGLPHHRISGVIKRDREDKPLGASEVDQFLRLRHRRRERLVADHVDAGLEKRLGDGVMEMVGRDDHHCLDAVRPRRLARGHFAEVGIDAIGGKAEIGAGRAGVGLVGGESPGLQFNQIIEPHRHPMHGADESVSPAADHADAQATPLGALFRCRVNHRLSPECRGV